MLIEVRLFAYFRDGRDKKLQMEFEEKPTIRQILNILEIPVEDVSIMLKNGKDALPDVYMENGDYVSLFPPVGGG